MGSDNTVMQVVRWTAARGQKRIDAERQAHERPSTKREAGGLLMRFERGDVLFLQKNLGREMATVQTLQRENVSERKGSHQLINNSPSSARI